MRKTTILLFLGITMGVAGNAAATGLMTCDSGDQTNWQSQQSLETAMLDAGWKVRRIKVDGGCYEVYGTTPEGQRVEAYYDPVTLEKLLVASRGEILFKKE